MTGRYQARSYKPEFPARNGVRLTHPPPPLAQVIPLPVRSREGFCDIKFAFPTHISNREVVVVLYKFPNFMTQSHHAAFDAIHEPGALTPYSGIYRCVGCGHEITDVVGRPLPPQNHHQHTYAQGRIRWQLAACDQPR